jgi:hypothetical protein
MQPPLLPAEALRRTVRLARLDGTTMLGIAGVFALASAAAKDVPGAIVGLLVAGAGAIELHGTTLLRGGAARGVNWLVASQLYLMIVVLTYVGTRLAHVDITPLRALLTDEQRTVVQQAGLTVDVFLATVYRVAYEIVGAATVLYQGGMALHYLRRRAPIAAALAAPGEA